MLSIKGVFKTLIGTMLLIVFSSLFVEYINITATTTFMNGMMSRSVEKSCDYFAQETYKNDGATGDVSTIVDSKGTPFCSGTFYTGNKEQVYNSLYGSDSAFADWYNSDYRQMKLQAGVGDKPMWLNLEILAKGLNMNSGALTSGDTALGKSYVENMMSPLNLGIPYLDKETVTKIAQWNLTYNLSEGFNSRLHMNETENVSGNTVALRPYVVYHGFRVFTKDLEINSIDYEVYDIRTAAGREEFKSATNMEAAQLYGGENKDDTAIIANLDERAYIGVATINYTVPMQYVGVTPMRSIINFVQNKTAVKGYGSMENQTAASEVMKTWTNKKTETTYSSEANVQNMAIKNKLVYYIVR